MSALVLIGMLATSCSKQQDPASEMVVKVRQNSEEDLVKDMAANQVLRDFFKDCNSLTNDYLVAYRKLTAGQRAVHAKSNDYLVRTGAEMKAYHELQAKRNKEIDSAFPRYAKMSDEQKAEVIASVLVVIPESGGTQDAVGGGCGAGYSACMKGCSSSSCGDPCWAGYKACIAATLTQ